MSGPRETSRSCTGAILAGGRARRFGGRAKGLELVGGRRIVDRVASALRLVTDDLLLVANDPAASTWLPGVHTVHDLVSDAGALGGLLTALEVTSGAVLVVAWDMPFVPPSLLGELRAEGERTGAVAVLPERDGAGRVEPLCAWYTPACRDAATQAVNAGDLRLAMFAERVGAHRLPLARVLDWGEPDRLFCNVNTSDALHAADALARGDV